MEESSLAFYRPFCKFLIVSGSKLISRPYLPHATRALIKSRDKISVRKQLYCGTNKEKVSFLKNLSSKIELAV